MPDIQDKVSNVVVLMLENRSFDHMLGFMDHPRPFNGLSGNESNPMSPSDPSEVFVSRDAVPNLFPDSDHSHKSVLRQLFLADPPYDALDNANNKGFVWNYGDRIDDTRAEQKKILKKIWSWIKRWLFKKKQKQLNEPGHIMRCFDYPDPPQKPQTRVLSALAREFALCDNWFCSVPGETWPNRNFLHSGTSAGEVDIKIKPYGDRTIFEQLSADGHDWAIFHDGPAQVMAFWNLWFTKGDQFKDMDEFYSAVADNKLPKYSFIEPRHFKLLQGYSNSQHPGNNPRDARDFYGGEKLICDIYNALTGNEEVWKKTLFIITYDEHGGLYDHEAPPYDPAKYADGQVSDQGFKFDLLGPRVPAVLVSPYIERETVDSTIYDHSSVVATIRKIFDLSEGHLTNRDKNATTFEGNLTRLQPRLGGDIPKIDCHDLEAQVTGTDLEKDDKLEFNDFQKSLIALTVLIREDIEKKEKEGLQILETLDKVKEFALEKIPKFKSELDLNAYFGEVIDKLRQTS